MFPIDMLILGAGVMLLLGIASSKFSARFGVPVLVLFLVLGMLAGSEGIGRIEFENYSVAHAIGTLALAIILFDGGLRTSLASIQSAWRPSLLLATVGVVITAVITGAAAAWILGLSILEGLLLGSIVGSTDAAAVFAILRSGGATLSQRLTATLEIESGSNDPMAIFLTVGCILVLSGQEPLGPGLLLLFVQQMSVGALVGLAIGYAAVLAVNRINLDAAGLYPALVSAFTFLTFGLAAWLGGSGFLAVYLAGIVIGNSRLVFRRGIFLFYDAGAWLSQISMFVVLGLLSFPSRLLAVGWQALLIGAVLILVARPVAVFSTLFPFRFSLRELTFLSWVGLKGAVPITLATFPLLLGVARTSLIFDVVFFVVVVSALVQGWSLPWLARRLGLQLPAEPTPPVTLEISSLRHVDADIVDYTVTRDSRAAGRRISDLALPEGVVIALISRAGCIIHPHGYTRIEPSDHVVIVLRPATRALVNHVFAAATAPRDELPPMLEFPLRASITVGELEEFYGIRMNEPATETLDQVLRRRLKDEATLADKTVHFGRIALHVRELGPRGTIQQVGMTIVPQQQADAQPSAADDVKTSAGSGDRGDSDSSNDSHSTKKSP